MLTSCDTCAIKNWSKRLNLDVDRRSYLVCGSRTKCHIDSVAASAGGIWYLFSCCDVCRLNALLIFQNSLSSSLSQISMSKRQLRVDLHRHKCKSWNKSGPKNQTLFPVFFSVTPSINVLLCCARSGVIVWGLGAENSGEQPLRLNVVADDGLDGLNSWPSKDRKNWYPSLCPLPWDQLKLWNEPKDEWPEGGCEITCPSANRVSL